MFIMLRIFVINYGGLAVVRYVEGVPELDRPAAAVVVLRVMLNQTVPYRIEASCDVIAAVTVKICVFLDVTPCSLVDIY
jgi:hypothetical protein